MLAFQPNRNAQKDPIEISRHKMIDRLFGRGYRKQRDTSSFSTYTLTQAGSSGDKATARNFNDAFGRKLSPFAHPIFAL